MLACLKNRQMFTIGSLKIPHRLLMAPMCGMTLKPFRRIVKDYGAGLVATQMVNAKALRMGDQKTLRLLDYDESERPITFQLFGNDADDLAEGARIAQDLGPDLIDLNMGCPAKKIVSGGGGSALLREPDLAKQILKKMRAVLKIPFTVKMRSGWDKEYDEAIHIAKIAQDSGVDAITLHARTNEQGYKGSANWKLIKAFRENLSIPVIGNGDVSNKEGIHRMLKETGCDAVMVGRAAISAPWIFKSYLTESDYQPTIEEKRKTILRQYELFFDFFGLDHGIRQMRKFLCTYTKGIRDGAAFRNRIVSLNEWFPLRNAINEFFAT